MTKAIRRTHAGDSGREPGPAARENESAADAMAAMDISGRLSDLANSPTNTELLYQNGALSKMADALQENCGRQH
jgi:hypothetical protein